MIRLTQGATQALDPFPKAGNVSKLRSGPGTRDPPGQCAGLNPPVTPGKSWVWRAPRGGRVLPGSCPQARVGPSSGAGQTLAPSPGKSLDLRLEHTSILTSGDTGQPAPVQWGQKGKI